MNILDESLQKAPDGAPNIDTLAAEYELAWDKLSSYQQQCRANERVRLADWAGKTGTGRKGKDKGTFPFPEASDQEVFLVDSIINQKKDMLMGVWRRSKVVAHPVGFDDIPRAKASGKYMEYTIKSRVRNFSKEWERGLDDLMQKGLVASHQFWDRETQNVVEKHSIKEVMQQYPKLAAGFQAYGSNQVDAEKNKDTLAILISVEMGVDEEEAQRILSELVEKQSVEIVKEVVTRNCPGFRKLSPDDELVLPNYACNLQELPYVFHKQRMTFTQIRDYVNSLGWDSQWAEYIIAHGTSATRKEDRTNQRRTIQTQQEDYSNLRDVIWCYQRLFDENGVPGIYCTIFAPGQTEAKENFPQPFAKHELTAYRQYPFAVTKFEERADNIYDSRGVPETGKGFQDQMKVEIDYQVDMSSMQHPGVEYPADREPAMLGPRALVPYRIQGETRFMDTPEMSPVSLDVRNDIRRRAAEYFGLEHPEVPEKDVMEKDAALVDKMFEHMAEVLTQFWDLCRHHGDEEEYYTVMGVGDVQKYKRGDPGENYNFWFSYTQERDPDKILERGKLLLDAAIQADRTGRMDTEALIEILVDSVGAGWGEHVLTAKETASEKAVEEERSAIAQMAAGFNLDVKVNDAHEIKLKVLEEWANQPDVMQARKQDPALEMRYEERKKKRMHQLEQKHNAGVGIQGGDPSKFGEA